MISSKDRNDRYIQKRIKRNTSLLYYTGKILNNDDDDDDNDSSKTLQTAQFRFCVRGLLYQSRNELTDELIAGRWRR